MSSIGRVVPTGSASGSLTQVWANVNDIRAKVGGCTINWAKIAALGSDETQADGTIILAGKKRIRYGMFLAEITAVGADQGKFALADPHTPATDGRQTLTRGRLFFVARNILEEDDMSDHPALFEGGKVFKDRMCLDVASPGYITLAQAILHFPELRLVY